MSIKHQKFKSQTKDRKAYFQQFSFKPEQVVDANNPHSYPDSPRFEFRSIFMM